MLSAAFLTKRQPAFAQVSSENGPGKKGDEVVQIGTRAHNIDVVRQLKILSFLLLAQWSAQYYRAMLQTAPSY